MTLSQIWFVTMAISDMQVWKLESGYVQGVSGILEGSGYYEDHASALAEGNDLYDAGGGNAALAESDRIYAAITQADPNIFYNIAAGNANEGRGAYNTSKAGRRRYSLQTGQDDTVYYEEKNEKGELHRSGKCDGLAKTRGTNPVASGGKGHKEQPWAAGCLYDNHTFVNGKDYHKTMTDDLKTGYSEQTLTANKTDTVDQKTEEWKRFDTRRNQKVTVSVISDFLILQTSSGDQPVLYHEGKSKTVSAQENFGEVNVDTDTGNMTGFTKLVTENPLAMKQGAAINVGSYNGHYETPETKYRGTGQGTRTATAFDNDSMKYNGITDELGKAEVKAGHTVTESSNRNVSCAATQQRLPRVNGLVITRSGVIQCPTNVNKEYTTGASYAFYRPLIQYTDDGKRYASATLKEDGKEQEEMREHPDGQTYKPYQTPRHIKTGYVAAGYASEKDNLLADEIARTGAISPEDEEECRYLKALGAASFGIRIPSVYTKGQTGCNNIVVHDPVSAELARITRPDSQGEDLDQRTQESILEAGSAKDLNQTAAESGSCPGIPGECSFRTLNCKYKNEVVRAAFTIDAYRKTQVADDAGNAGTADTENNYSYTIYSSVVNDNGGTPGFSLSGTGFVIRSEDGGIPPVNPQDVPEGTDYRLEGNGNASLPFAFYRMGIDSSNMAERVRIGADITIKSASRMPLITTDHTRLFTEADGFLSVETDDGAHLRSTARICTPGTTHRLELTVCFGTISDFTVTADGRTVTFTEQTAPSGQPYEGEICGPDFYLGNSAGQTKYPVHFAADNIQVTRLPGTDTHTDACYLVKTVHAAAVQNSYNGIQKDSIDWTGKKDDGSSRITSEKNTHTHTGSCLTSASKGFAIAYTNGLTDASDLQKMVGDTLWNKIVQKYSLKKNSSGNYALMQAAGNTVRTYNKGQTVSLPTGSHKIEIYATSASGAAGICQGGYAAGTLYTDKPLTVSLAVDSSAGAVSLNGETLLRATAGSCHVFWTHSAGCTYEGQTHNSTSTTVCSVCGHSCGGFTGTTEPKPGTAYADSSRLTGTSTSLITNGDFRIVITTTAYTTVDREALFAFINENRTQIPDTVTTRGKTIINPIWNCKCIYDRHQCSGGCRTGRELQCTEPHHEDRHYDYSSRICYDACCIDDNHRQYQTEVTDEKGNVVRADNFILLDNYFDVYFPNRGSFQELDSHGIAETQIERGMGYTADMDTTEWTREKWIKFPFSVLYNRNGTWEEHPAGEWFQIEIFGPDGSTLSTYHFYCQLKNDEMGSCEAEYAVEAINHETSPGEVEKMTTTELYHERHKNALWPYQRDDIMTIDGPTDGSESTNRPRYGSFAGRRYWAYEDCWNHSFTDVVGRIGNLIVEDTDDLRFSNLFKETTDEGWLIDGILKTVDPARPSHYLSWWRNDGTTAVDIRGEKVSRENEWYNTYRTQAWTNRAKAVKLPLQASENSVEALRNAANELRLGYNVLWDISTIGNYADGTLQVIPYYYALNIRTGTLTPVDVYIDSGETVQPVNYFGLVDDLAAAAEGSSEQKEAAALAQTLYAYNMTLNWSEEAARRNYSSQEKLHTESLASDNRYGSFAYDADGNMVMRPVTLYNEEDGTYTAGEAPLVYNLTIPYGNMDFVLGTEQLLYISCEPTATGNDGGRARTFIGGSTVTALGKNINGSDETNLLGTDARDYQVKGQRWHVTLGLPSTAEFVAYRGKKHVNPNELITVNGESMYAREEFKPDDTGACDYVILMTADIKVLGDVYNLIYSQGTDNGVYRASNGSTFRFSDDIPTLLAVYGIGDTNTPDLDIMQTH